MSIISLLGTAVLAVIILLFLKQLKSNVALPLGLVFAILLTNEAIKISKSELSFITSLVEETFSQKTTSVLLKVFGISLAVESISDICRDAGEGLIASKIETVGKLEILTVCIPLIKEILEITKEIMF